MSVYVDNMEAPFGRMIMCHMWADTYPELIAMAKAIAVDVKWLQYPPKASWVHFDIAKTKRAEAIRCGAVPAQWRDASPASKRQRLDISYSPFYPGFLEGYAAGQEGLPHSSCPYSYQDDGTRYYGWCDGNMYAWYELGLKPPSATFDDDIPF